MEMFVHKKRSGQRQVFKSPLNVVLALSCLGLCVGCVAYEKKRPGESDDIDSVGDVTVEKSHDGKSRGQSHPERSCIF